MKREKNSRRSFPLRARFQYWFDNRMARGSLGLIRVMIIGSVAFAVLMALLAMALQGREGPGLFTTVWNSIATVINADMPFVEDGSESLGYLIPMAVVAILGVVVTSVLIGVFSSAIEEKIYDLKRGNSLVLEQGHIVVLGFYPGEFTLLKQLILAAAGKPACVVIAAEMERETMEQDIKENLDVPANFRIVCRTADITDPASLEKCSVETCKTIIVSPTDDLKTIKAVLAVSALMEEKGTQGVSVNAIISKQEYRFPPSLAEANNISTIQTNNVLAKLIAHSCTQMGLSEAFREVFNFEGAEFYLVEIPGMAGLSFMELMLRLDGAVPAGVYHDGRVILNPHGGFLIGEGDKLLVFAEESASAVLEPEKDFKQAETINVRLVPAEDLTDTVIIGHNETLPVLLHELPLNVTHVYLAGQSTMGEEERAELEETAAARNMVLQEFGGDLHSEEDLTELAKLAEHVVILNDHDRDPEEADMEAIFLLMNLRDIRKRYGLSFNITVEMQKEHNQKIVRYGDHTDFLVSSSMSSLILAQLAESPELISVFREILSNEGNELYLKDVGELHMKGAYAVRGLRRMLLEQGYIFLGYLDAEKNSRFNNPLESTITLDDGDNLVVLGTK